MPNRFDYVKYDSKSTEAQASFKEAFQGLEKKVDTLPNGRAKALVHTKLEEAYMWVGKALRDDQVARDPGTPEQPERENS